MKIIIPESPSIGIVICTYGSLPYVHLGLEALRRHEPNLPVLIHDDCSPQSAKLQAIAHQYSADFVSTDFRKVPTVGDLSGFVEALRWARNKGIDIVVKISRRFILNRPWVDGLRDLMVNTQYCTASGVCGTFLFGFRSEWVAMYVPAWHVSGAFATMQEAVKANKPYDSLPEAWTHNRCREVHRWAHPMDEAISHAENVHHPNCDLLVRSEKIFLRPDNYDGYAWYAGLLRLGRHQKIKGTLWHDSASPTDYAQLANDFELPYQIDDFSILSEKMISLAIPEKVMALEMEKINGLETRSRILIGICSCNQYAHKRQAVRDTWLRTLQPGITALFFIGEGAACDEPGLVQLPCPDDYGHLPAKVQSFFRYALTHYDFDYLFKCDDDTYVHTKRLLDLPRPEVDFIGNELLFSSGYAHGGAGYLISRELVKRFVEKSISAHGAEDRVFSSLALASGLKAEISHELHGDPDDPPEFDNSVITAHWCDPTQLHNIHEELFGEGSRAVLKLKAKHPDWSELLFLYADGSFRGKGIHSNGTWKVAQGGTYIILKWPDGLADSLKLQPWGFEKGRFRLKFLHQRGIEQWQQLRDMEHATS